jgi:hypothetical protein
LRFFEGGFFMKSGIICVISLALAAWSTASVRAQPASADNAVLYPEAHRNGWLFSLEEGQAQARKSAKPLLVLLRCNP